MSDRIQLPRGRVYADLAPIRRFSRRDDGSLIVFGLFIFVLMLMICGMAIDLMRLEAVRARLQGTVDRATLAAASLSNPLEPMTVVTDYFAKANLTEHLVSVTVDEGFGYRTISTQTAVEIDTSFLELSGIETLGTGARGTAEERANKVEISLVLDISGSMNNNNKDDMLKDAASEFVHTILTGEADNESFVSVVPYYSQVVLGEELWDLLNVQEDHPHSRCIALEPDDFDTTTISPTQPLNQVAHFERTSHWNWHPIDRPECRTTTRRAILPYEDNATQAAAMINDLPTGGNTAIDLGMKWGVALLDPAMKPVLNQLIADGEAAGKLAGHPLPWSDGEVLKVLVLMTDGMNTTRYDINPEFKSGPSVLWQDSNNSKHSFYLEPPWPPKYSGQRYFWGYRYNCNFWSDEHTAQGPNPRQMTWQEVWYEHPTYQFVDCIVRDVDGRTSAGGDLEDWWDDNIVDVVAGPSTADAQLLQVCNAAKQAGIIVYTIGFEAPSHSQALMEQCASSPSHYYDVDGIEISNAFNAIAQSVQLLKLIE